MPYKANPDTSIGASPLIEVDASGRTASQIAAEDPGAAKFLVALVGFALTPLLYPITTAILVGAGLGASAVIGAVAQPLAGWTRLALVAAPIVVLFVVLMRIEQRMGTWRAYRWTRHAMRLLIPGLFFNQMIRSDMGLPDPNITTFVSETLGNSALLGSLLGPAVGMQLLLWFAGAVRADWHASLVAMRMRAASLD
ncbi:MAG: hypothetical protein IT360_22015 [Gemmatimonadaceae bacterium]|nr:hypothetical protein [Gemmatimonadaceae bacterium]